MKDKRRDREQKTLAMIIPLNFYYAEFYCCFQIRHFQICESKSESESECERAIENKYEC